MASSADGAGGETRAGEGAEAAGADPAQRCPASPAAKEGELCRGRCKWFDVSKGYGFVTPDDNSGDIFVYQSSIQMDGFRSLDDNEAVEFVYKISDKGREAVTVTGPDGCKCKGSKRKGRGKRKKDDRCYNCNDHGHHAKNCPQPPLPKRCHHCKSEDHLVADCPDRPAQTAQGNGDGDKPTSGDDAGAPNGDPHTSAAPDGGGTS